MAVSPWLRERDAVRREDGALLCPERRRMEALHSPSSAHTLYFSSDSHQTVFHFSRGLSRSDYHQVLQSGASCFWSGTETELGKICSRNLNQISHFSVSWFDCSEVQHDNKIEEIKPGGKTKIMLRTWLSLDIFTAIVTKDILLWADIARSAEACFVYPRKIKLAGWYHYLETLIRTFMIKWN